MAFNRNDEAQKSLRHAEGFYIAEAATVLGSRENKTTYQSTDASNY